jgi:hypothetical protein
MRMPGLLATFCAQSAVSIPTIDAIYRYLLVFQHPSSRADDFECTAKLLKGYATRDSPSAAASCANYVHPGRHL